jgi:integrase
MMTLGTWRFQVSEKGTPTRYPGVTRLSNGRFRLRARVRNYKTGEAINLDRNVEAPDEHEANRLRAKQIADLDAPRVEARERTKLRAYAASWYASKLPKLKASTREHYQEVLDNHVLNVVLDPETGAKFGDYYCNTITLQDLVTWRDMQSTTVITTVNKQEPKGPPLCRITAPSTVNTRMRVLKEVISNAVHDLGLTIDPTRRLESVRVPRKTGKGLTAVELRTLLEKAQEHVPEWYPFFFLLSYTGLRFGEASALRWSDIDSEEGKIWIRVAQWKGEVDTTKTDCVRSVPLVPELQDVLVTHWAAQREKLINRVKRERVTDLRDANVQSVYVFPANRRKGVVFMHNTAPRKALLLCLEKAGITRRFTVHGFRHTFNNLVRQVDEARGNAIVLRAMTGHSSEAMTEHYSEVAIEEKRRAVAGLLRLVQGQTQPLGKSLGRTPSEAVSTASNGGS